MKVSKFFKAFSLAFLTYASVLSADTLLDSTNFNVTLSLVPANYLTVGDLDFGVVNPARIDNTGMPLESTTSSVIAYSNSASGHYVQIVASDPKYLSADGNSFLMRGTATGNNDSIAFILNTSTNVDGSNTATGVRQLLPNTNIIGVDGTDANHKVVRDLWATLVDNGQLQTVASDMYLAILTANHYSNQ